MRLAFAHHGRKRATAACRTKPQRPDAEKARDGLGESFPEVFRNTLIDDLDLKCRAGCKVGLLPNTNTLRLARNRRKIIEIA